jgi:hypothetical protein
MSKRAVSDLSDEHTDNSGRDSKRQKTLPHRGKIEAFLDEFLDFLSPAAPKSLSKFNKREEAEERWGVTAIDIDRMKMHFEELQDIQEIEALDAKLEEINSYLAGFQTTYTDYISDVVEKGDKVYVRVKVTLDDVVWRIQKARERLTGIFSYWINCYGKTKRYYS